MALSRSQPSRDKTGDRSPPHVVDKGQDKDLGIKALEEPRKASEGQSHTAELGSGGRERSTGRE